MKNSPMVKMQFNDGEYTGVVIDNMRNGIGTMLYVNGDKYFGNFKNNKRDGCGKMIFSNKNRYEGEFKEDLINGHGIMIYNDGSTYNGMWLNNLKNGYGTYINKIQNIRYFGEWEDDMYHGIGTLYVDNGIYSGDFIYNKKCGFGEYFINGKCVFCGSWEDDVRRGKGVMYTTNYIIGCVWKDKFIESDHVDIIYNNGDIYLGEFYITSNPYGFPSYTDTTKNISSNHNFILKSDINNNLCNIQNAKTSPRHNLCNIQDATQNAKTSPSNIQNAKTSSEFGLPNHTVSILNCTDLKDDINEDYFNTNNIPNKPTFIGLDLKLNKDKDNNYTSKFVKYMDRCGYGAIEYNCKYKLNILDMIFDDYIDDLTNVIFCSLTPLNSRESSLSNTPRSARLNSINTPRDECSSNIIDIYDNIVRNVPLLHINSTNKIEYTHDDDHEIFYCGQFQDGMYEGNGLIVYYDSNTKKYNIINGSFKNNELVTESYTENIITTNPIHYIKQYVLNFIYENSLFEKIYNKMI